MTRLRVGMNALFLKPGRVGGTEEYVRRLVSALEHAASDEVALTLFVNRRFAASLPESTAASRAIAPVSGDSPPIRIAIESTWLAREAVRRSIDVVHHLGNTIPQVRTRPAVVTIHDIQPIVRPGDFGRVKGGYLREPAPIRGSRVSSGHDPERIRATSGDRTIRTWTTHGSSWCRPRSISPRPSTGRRGRRCRTRSRSRSSCTPRSRIPTRTTSRSCGRSPRSPPPTLASRSSSPVGRARRSRPCAARSGPSQLRERVRRLGRITRPDLDRLLRRAVALTFPSRHEGYGLPVAEAMALGCPVIASDAAAIPEVVGDAGLLVDPDDVGGWVAAMSSMLGNDDLRATLIANGRERVASLSPDETARRLVDAYRVAAAAE